MQNGYYYDGTRTSALLLQVIIEAPQSSGKQFAADIERLLMDHTLKAHDQEQRRLEQKYRERKRARGANEKMEEELWMFAEELAQVTDAGKQGYSNLRTIMMADTYTPEGALRPEMLLDTSWIERDVRRWCQQKGKEALRIEFLFPSGRPTIGFKKLINSFIRN